MMWLLSFKQSRLHTHTCTQVGSNWDGKESIFRNYGDILGVWDEPVAAIRLTPGQYTELEITWDDPVGIRVSKFTMKLESGWFVSFHKPKLERPIRPGLWTTKVQMKNGVALIQTQFLVVPLTHENKEPLANPLSFNAVRTIAPPHNTEFSSWMRNVSKSGAELEAWVDELVGQYWTIDGYCGLGAGAPGDMGGGGGCGWMPDCASSGWSTLSPDPKSELGKIQSNGRLR